MPWKLDCSCAELVDVTEKNKTIQMSKQWRFSFIILRKMSMILTTYRAARFPLAKCHMAFCILDQSGIHQHIGCSVAAATISISIHTSPPPHVRPLPHPSPSLPTTPNTSPSSLPPPPPPCLRPLFPVLAAVLL